MQIVFFSALQQHDNAIIDWFSQMFNTVTELFIKIHNDEQHLMAMRSKILKEDITEYPSFAFKRNIIRIIANISWTDKFLKVITYFKI